MVSSRPLYRIEAFDDHHRRKGFSCGDDVLDRYFYKQAGQDQRRNITRMYVAVDSSDRVAGFFTLSSFTIRPENLPPDISKKLPHYPAFPAILIGRLAVDLQHRNQKLGGTMLMRALRECYELSQRIGIMAVLVEAKNDEAVSFYEHFSFQCFEGETLRLYMPMTEIAKIVSF